MIKQTRKLNILYYLHSHGTHSDDEVHDVHGFFLRAVVIGNLALALGRQRVVPDGQKQRRGLHAALQILLGRFFDDVSQLEGQRIDEGEAQGLGVSAVVVVV